MYNITIYKDYGWCNYGEILHKTYTKFMAKIWLKKLAKQFNRKLTLLGYETMKKHKNYADIIVNKVYYKIIIEKESKLCSELEI